MLNWHGLEDPLWCPMELQWLIPWKQIPITMNRYFLLGQTCSQAAAPPFLESPSLGQLQFPSMVSVSCLIEDYVYLHLFCASLPAFSICFSSSRNLRCWDFFLTSFHKAYDPFATNNFLLIGFLMNEGYFTYVCAPWLFKRLCSALYHWS